MGFAEKVFQYVTHKRGAEKRADRSAVVRKMRSPEANLPEFLDEVPQADVDREERQERQHQWRPRPLGDDLPLSG